MKKLVLLFTVMLMSTTSFAQEHLDFRGVPIDGHIDDFVSKMEGLGYTLEKKVDNAVIMEGRFTNKDVNVYILSTPQTNTVWKVAVYFDEATSWSSIKNSYREYKDLYKKKYGVGESYEFFSDPYYEGDGYELQALRKEKCNYVTYFEPATGYVTVKMSSSECIVIAYEDKVNTELKKKEQTSSALDEI